MVQSAAAAPEQLLAKKQLKARGWSEALITALLGAPDSTRSNPHYRTGPKMQLYRQGRVEAAEASPQFRQATAKREGRQAAARKAVATKRARLNSYVENVTITVPQLEKGQLIREACAHYNGRQSLRGLYASSASPSSAPWILDRITVNMLRHRMTSYESHLARIAGRVGTGDAYVAIKGKVLDAIAEAYPWLAEECACQKEQTAGEALARRGR